MKLLCAALGAAFLFVATQHSALAEESTLAPPLETGLGDDVDRAAVYELLRAGGNVLVMRHANSPGGQLAPVGMTEGCKLAEGRGLDAKGFHQARSLGEMLKAEGVPILKAYTSQMCRAWDTATLAAGGAPVISHPSQMTTNPQAIADFKKALEAELAANPGQNIILSNHSNIAPLYGAIVVDGEEELPSGIISIVRPDNWEGGHAPVRIEAPTVLIVESSKKF